ncbi:DUF2333 family protein [Ketobacter sp.]|uniref:DUF2333 family protein n=1 Tax=Ketobacter sp. TaxID=2083498 RepID=UPI000F1C3DA1|nr:DUF2333 family protein [Ketobacter sp.]RLT92281.1 MAG: DUF2333 family protein [Ketobacter sp.]
MWAKLITGLIVVYLLIAVGLGVYWSSEPDVWDVPRVVEQDAAALGKQPAIGFATTSTMIRLGNSLLEKPGGYITNDITPPGLWLDNIANWEFGVLVQIRDMSRALRKDIARSQSTSREDVDLARAEPQLHFDHKSFWFPSTESEYRRGIQYLEAYQVRLLDDDVSNAQFYARADNLRNWLADVETRLGSLSQKLSASVGKEQINVDLAGDAAARQSTRSPQEMRLKTPFTQIDDVFYEARGASYALIHLLKAIEIDFKDILEKKNAMVSLRQIVRELESTQQSVGSPMILNGSGFGIFANHSLVMANYISRANAAIIDLRRLLEQG